MPIKIITRQNKLLTDNENRLPYPLEKFLISKQREIGRLKSREGFGEFHVIRASEQLASYIYTIDYSRFLFNLEVK